MAGHSNPPSDLTWLGSDRPLARRVGRPVARFLSVEAAGGVLLILATVAALIWANSPWKDSYADVWHTVITIEVGGLLRLEEDLEHWINDALMAIFFFVVGLEIKRELVAGQLRDTRAAALPAMAAIGGMVVPALLFFVFTAGTDGADGWGIPMATDIAFAVGVVSLLGNRVPVGMKVFLLTLAIVDDIGAILVIAIFYTSDVSTGWLLVAALTVMVIIALRQARIWFIPLYVVVGTFLWLAVFESGVHATIAGVVLGLITPAKPLAEVEKASEMAAPIVQGSASSVGDVRQATFHIKETVSVAERLEDILHPFTSYLIIPLFALANAGIEFSGDTISDAASSSLTWGVIVGLVVGKLLGVSAFTLLAVKLGVSSLPEGAGKLHVFGIASIAGIGFTVSLFITGLAFDAPVLQEESKMGILFASIAAAAIGALLLARAKPAETHAEPRLTKV